MSVVIPSNYHGRFVPIVDIYGDRGSGKTRFMAYIAWKNPDIPMIADFKLKTKNYIPLELDELLTMKYTLGTVMLDELDVYADNRRSMSTLNIFLGRVAKQSRKTGLELVSSAQLLDTIDSRITRLTNLSIIALGEDEKFCYYDLVYKSMFGYNIVNLKVKSDFMNSLNDVYDTSELIVSDDVEEMSIDVKSQKKRNIEVEKVCKEIIERKEEFGLTGLKRITEKKVCDILMQLEKPESLAFYVVSRLEQRLNM